LEDKAWAEFKTPLNAGALLEFCNDPEVLFRINPYLEIISWEKLPDNNYKIHVTNFSQVPEFEVQTDFEKQVSTRKIQLQYNSGIKSNTVFSVESIPEGSKLTITENYNINDNNVSEDYLHFVDKSLTKWAEEIQNFLIQWKRWCWFYPWRLYKLRVWLSMKPSARRISDVILFVSAFEVILIILGIAIYLSFYK